jgi:hypothetical protein
MLARSYALMYLQSSRVSTSSLLTAPLSCHLTAAAAGFGGKDNSQQGLTRGFIPQYLTEPASKSHYQPADSKGALLLHLPSNNRV